MDHHRGAVRSPEGGGAPIVMRDSGRGRGGGGANQSHRLRVQVGGVAASLEDATTPLCTADHVTPAHDMITGRCALKCK